jgi:hypothetical protein
MAASGALKRCTKCRREKPRAEFSRDRSRPDGRYPQCKACVRQWHQDNAKRLAEYNRRWREANRDRSERGGVATRSGSARTLSIESDGEPTPAAAIGSGAPRTPTMLSAGERTTAATGSESEPDCPGQTTAQRTRRRGGRPVAGRRPSPLRGSRASVTRVTRLAQRFVASRSTATTGTAPSLLPPAAPAPKASMVDLCRRSRTAPWP